MGNCARPSIAPLFFRGVWAAAVIHGAALALDLALGLAVSRPWLNNVLSKATQRPLSRFAVSGLCGLVQGCYAPPKPPVAPARSAPSGRSARRLLGSGEWTMPTEYDYEITPRTLGLGGGWNLRLLENGEEVGGGVFPLPEHCDFRDEKALQTLLDSLYEDALAEASAWLASR